MVGSSVSLLSEQVHFFVIMCSLPLPLEPWPILGLEADILLLWSSLVCVKFSILKGSNSLILVLWLKFLSLLTHVNSEGLCVTYGFYSCVGLSGITEDGRFGAELSLLQSPVHVFLKSGCKIVHILKHNA